MENMNNLLSIRCEANNSFTELKKTIYQMYPAMNIEDIEETIALLNKAEVKLNDSVQKAIVSEYNRDLNKRAMEQPRRSHKMYDLDRILGLIVPF